MSPEEGRARGKLSERCRRRSLAYRVLHQLGLTNVTIYQSPAGGKGLGKILHTVSRRDSAEAVQAANAWLAATYGVKVGAPKGNRNAATSPAQREQRESRKAREQAAALLLDRVTGGDR